MCVLFYILFENQKLKVLLRCLELQLRLTMAETITTTKSTPFNGGFPRYSILISLQLKLLFSLLMEEKKICCCESTSLSHNTQAGAPTIPILSNLVESGEKDMLL